MAYHWRHYFKYLPSVLQFLYIQYLGSSNDLPLQAQNHAGTYKEGLGGGQDMET